MLTGKKNEKESCCCMRGKDTHSTHAYAHAHAHKNSNKTRESNKHAHTRAHELAHARAQPHTQRQIKVAEIGAAAISNKWAQREALRGGGERRAEIENSKQRGREKKECFCCCIRGRGKTHTHTHSHTHRRRIAVGGRSTGRSFQMTGGPVIVKSPGLRLLRQ